MSVVTLPLYAMSGTGAYTDGGLLLTWGFFSWNFYAYGFDRDMWPVTFVQLDGGGKGHPVAREAVFWSTCAVYLVILAMIAWGG